MMAADTAETGEWNMYAEIAHELRFDSWDAFVRRSEMPETPMPTGRGGRSSRREDSNGFFGTPDFPTAAKLARSGWQDGAERLSELTARLSGRLGNLTAVKRIGFDVMGPGTLDIGRYSIGHPESMMVWQPSEETTDINPSRMLRIVCAGTMSADTDAEYVYWRGAAAYAICDLAESQGVRCEIEIAYSATGNRGRRAVQWVMLKRAQDPVTADILAFALCSASSLRRMGFAVQETLPAAIREEFGFGKNGGYGHPSYDLEPDQYGDAIYMPGMVGPGPFRNAQTTSAYVIDTLRQHEIEVERS